MYSLNIESYFVRKQENFKFFLKNVPKSFVGSGICCTFASAFASKLRFSVWRGISSLNRFT